MKKYLIIFIAVVILGACDLDMQPESELTYNGFWETEEAARAAHTGIYDKLRNYQNTLWQMGELRSDIWGGNTIESPSGIDLIDNNISTTIVHFDNWANYYGLMHYINDFIVNAPDVPFANEEDKNQMLGQVYGMRALIYYTMVKAWGDVPISIEPVTEIDSEELYKPRAPKAEVMSQIKDDIQKSLAYFGSNNNLWSGKNIFWSKAATLALKGDVYLWSGEVLGGGSSDFTEAKAALSQIDGFSLVPMAKLWGQENENNNEFIFAFDYQQDQAGNYSNYFTGRAVDFVNLFDDEGNSMADFVVNGASRFGPSDKALLVMDDLFDMRRNTFIRMYDTGDGYIPYQSELDNYKGAVTTKFLGVIGEDGLRKNYNNIPLYRYADVLLMLAEAKNQLNEDPADEINAVRARAYGDNFPGNEYSNGSQEENTNAILEERMKEFVGEGKRWWDLVRAGDGIVFDEVESLSEDEAYKIYYSISQNMLANDPALEQTEGYN